VRYRREWTARDTPVPARRPCWPGGDYIPQNQRVLCHTRSFTRVPPPIASPKSPPVLMDSVSEHPCVTNLRVPKSPRTPGTVATTGTTPAGSTRPMTHMINLRFTKTFKPARCDYCQEYFFNGLKCKEQVPVSQGV